MSRKEFRKPPATKAMTVSLTVMALPIIVRPIVAKKAAIPTNQSAPSNQPTLPATGKPSRELQLYFAEQQRVKGLVKSTGRPIRTAARCNMIGDAASINNTFFATVGMASNGSVPAAKAVNCQHKTSVGANCPSGSN